MLWEMWVWQMKRDPFDLKKFPRWHPKRLFPTLQARLDDRFARWRYPHHALPLKLLEDLPSLPAEPDWNNTALRVMDMQYLLYVSWRCREDGIPGAFVEVGCYRGVTTRFLAETAHSRSVFAVDPFMGYGGEESDYQIFLQNVGDLDNVHHLRMTSGDAFRRWDYGPLAFVFVDSLHNYANTNFDVAAWGSLLVHGGFLAAHDTDNPGFAGTRRAVFEAAMQEEYELYAHPSNLTILRKQ